MNFFSAAAILGGVITGGLIAHYIDNKTNIIKENITRSNTKSVKVFISTPMNGLTTDEIMKAIEHAKKEAKPMVEKYYWEGINIEFVHNYIPESDQIPRNVNHPLYCMSKAVEKMSYCNVVFFNEGWEDSRGCDAEYNLAKNYGLVCLFHH